MDSTIAMGEGLAIVYFIMGMLLISLVAIASNVLLAFCVFNDAKYRGCENAMLWAVLSGLFNIAALVYIIVQVSTKPKGTWCKQCGVWLVAGSMDCPRCGTIIAYPPPQEQELYKKRRKLFLILWIVSIAFILVASMVFIGMFVASTINQFN